MKGDEMGPSPDDEFQTATPDVTGRSWATMDGRTPCPRNHSGRRRHCLHHRFKARIWYCCACPHTRTDDQAMDPTWREDDDAVREGDAQVSSELPPSSPGQ